MRFLFFVCFWLRLAPDNGKVIKAVRTDAGQPVVIEEIQVFPLNVPVTNLLIHRGRNGLAEGGSTAGGLGGGGTSGADADARLIVSSQSELVALKLQRCYSDKVSTCRSVIDFLFFFFSPSSPTVSFYSFMFLNWIGFNFMAFLDRFTASASNWGIPTVHGISASRNVWPSALGRSAPTCSKMWPLESTNPVRNPPAMVMDC